MRSGLLFLSLCKSVHSTVSPETNNMSSPAGNKIDKRNANDEDRVQACNMPESPVPPQNPRDKKLGMLLGLTSAVAYSATNLALRQLSDSSADLGWDIWVSAMKAVPTLVVSIVLVLLRQGPGKGSLYPSYKVVMVLLVAALIMQFGGNLCFQIALGNIGLAISVPFVFALIIFSGAFFGKIFVGDTVSTKTMISIVIMAASVVLLSYAASQQQETASVTARHTAAQIHTDTASNTDTAPSTDPVRTDINQNQQSGSTSSAQQLASSTEAKPLRYVSFGIFMAIISGLSYGINGIVIRSLGQKKLTVQSMTLVYSSVGFVCLSSLGFSQLGFERIRLISLADWSVMLVAGSLNAIAFFALTNALKRLDISRVNVINASQNAMCALGAFLVFAEPMSALTVTGILLSIIGLVVLDRK